MNRAVISVENLSKSYRLGQIGTGTLTNDLKLWWAKKRGLPNPLLKIGQSDHGTRGVYLWRRLVEEHPDAELRERYWRRYGSFSAGDLLKINAGLVEKIGNEYFDYVETVLLGIWAAR